MTIVIAILKVIGIILVSVLGLAILFILLALFLPVSYSVLGISEEDVMVKGKIYWLFHLITFHFLYKKNEFSSEVRIFGIRLKKKKPDLTDVYDEYEIEEDIEEQTIDNVENDVEEKITDDAEEKTSNDIENEFRNEKKLSFWNKILEKGKRITQSISHFFEAFQTIRKNGKEWISLLTKEENKATMFGVLGELKYLLKHFGIRRIRSDLVFSTGDPALTGQVLGGLCLLPFLYQKGVHVCPDFETDEFYIKGELEVSGHLRMVHILRSGIHLWKDKNLRELIKSMIK
ncbi:MAG: DUF2953 domain-containing protein [Roseburia sp.]